MNTNTGNKERIAFVGVGRMGANMARRLNDEGFDVAVVYDLQKKVANKLAKEIGATATASLAKVTELADVGRVPIAVLVGVGVVVDALLANCREVMIAILLGNHAVEDTVLIDTDLVIDTDLGAAG